MEPPPARRPGSAENRRESRLVGLIFSRAASLVSGPTTWSLFVRVVTIVIVVVLIARLVPVTVKIVRGRRPLFFPAWVAGLIATIAVLGFFSYLSGTSSAHQMQPPISMSGKASKGHLSTSRVDRLKYSAGKDYLGVFEARESVTYRAVLRFGKEVGHQPNIVLRYISLNSSFPARFAFTAASHNAIVLIDINPGDMSMSAISSGRYDSYIHNLATEVRAYGYPVLLSFAPEANGPWYRWGWTHVSPATWVAAWRHVVRVFRQQGTWNAQWVWVINRSSSTTGPIQKYWPGSSYVSMVGIDGYIFTRAETFGNSFAPTIREVRKFTRKPVLLSEVGIGQVAGQARMLPSVFAGILKYHLIGIVWYDVAQNHGIYHQDWRLEGHHRALAAFRRGVAEMFADSQRGGPRVQRGG